MIEVYTYLKDWILKKKINSVENLKMKGKVYANGRKYHYSIQTLFFAEAAGL